jgi:PQQ-dependent dehydrogenase (methanol/ethanol family)
MNRRPTALRTTITALGIALTLATSAVDGGGPLRAPSGKDFPTVGANLANQRHSTLAKINKSNIGRLGGAWMIHLEDGQAAGTMQATPVVVDGVLFISTGIGNVLAVDGKTGVVKWKYQSGGRPGTNRGVAVGDGKVFAGQRDNWLVALDQKTGARLWRTQLAQAGPGTISAPATYYNGRVYIGVGGGELGVRGQFGAYDARTGKELWKFWTVPGPGERGHDTWEGDSWKSGGAPVWTHPAIDPELGTVYVAVGNAGPDNDGTARGGDNLYAASVLALDLESGAYKWHFQEVHHDVWDYDNAGAPVLADVRFEGRTRKILMHAGKTGMMYILDRVTGKPLIGIEERAVEQEPRMKTSPTQPYPKGDSFVPTCPEPGSVNPKYRTSCIFGAYWTEPVVMAPGTQGGLSWAPMAFSPETGLIYVPGSVINSGFGLRRQVWDEEARTFRAIGEGRGFFRPEGEPRSGTLTAMNPATNKIVWQKRTKFPLGTGSGLLSTAAGILFHGESDGRLLAYDTKTGETLWQFQTGAGADAPVATYEVDGEQYVAILSGGNTFQLSQRGDNLWAFKLGGQLPPAAAPPEPPTTQPGPVR